MAIPVSANGLTALIPDDLFGLEYPGVGFRFFAVEIDRNTESIERKNLGQTAFGRKVSGYLDVLRKRTYQSHWGLPNLTVLTVTTNATHVRNILDYVDKHCETALAGRFAIKCEPSFGAHWHIPRDVLSDLLDEQWVTFGGHKYIGTP